MAYGLRDVPVGTETVRLEVATGEAYVFRITVGDKVVETTVLGDIRELHRAIGTLIEFHEACAVYGTGVRTTPPH